MAGSASNADAQSADGRCMARVQSALGDMMSAASGGSKSGSRRHNGVSFGYMDLSGYALHQRLRTAPGAEMYVTGMRVKVMSPRDASPAESSSGDRCSWARVDECRYDPTGNTLEARMRFGRPLMVSGSVRLLYGGNRGGGGGGPTETGCDMTLRLRPRAGLGFTAVPMAMPEKSPPNRLTATAPMTIRTTATFIDPEPADVDPAAAYVSVHSYNCVGGAAGAPGNRERPVAAASAAPSDRFEQFLSAEEDGGADGPWQQSGGGVAGDTAAEFDIDLDDDGGYGFGVDSLESGDKRGGSRRPAATAPLLGAATSAAPPTAVAANPAVRPFSPAGFVTIPGPEPRLRRIQYHGSKPHVQQQHPLLSVASANSHQHHQHTQDHLLMEMEEVFVRGVRSLLAKHMERTLQPVLKDSLMVNMGYTVSYG